MSNAVQTILSFLTTNSHGFFPAKEILRITKLSEVEFKAAWASLKKSGKVVTHPQDKKFWGLAQ
jgi:uncharacterized glyoxalase superfamily protein PhnB